MLRHALSLLTGPRYAVALGRDFEWSANSWTHNFFRVFEIVFGRKVGIQVEMASVNDGFSSRQYAFTVEAQFALFETFLREIPKRLPRLEIVPVPGLYAPGFGSLPSFSPYCFAIAFDAASAGDGGTNTATPASTSHTCTGSNLALATGIWNQATSGSRQTPNSITYAGVTLGANKVAQDNSATVLYTVFLYGQASPTTGTNNLTWTYASSAVRNGNCNVSMTGCAASPFGATGNATVASSSSISASTTTTAANSWVVSFMNQDATAGQSTPTGTNQTERTFVATAGGYMIDMSTQTTTTAGSYTAGWSMTNPGTMDMVSLEVKELAASGPANVKTFDGVTQSTGIKTYLGNTVANTKSVNGVT